MLSFDSPVLGCGHLVLFALLPTLAFWLYIPTVKKTYCKSRQVTEAMFTKLLILFPGIWLFNETRKEEKKTEANTLLCLSLSTTLILQSHLEDDAGLLVHVHWSMPREWKCFIHTVPLVHPSVYPLLHLWISDQPKANTRKYRLI